MVLGWPLAEMTLSSLPQWWESQSHSCWWHALWSHALLAYLCTIRNTGWEILSDNFYGKPNWIELNSAYIDICNTLWLLYNAECCMDGDWILCFSRIPKMYIRIMYTLHTMLGIACTYIVALHCIVSTTVYCAQDVKCVIALHKVNMHVRLKCQAC